MCVCVCVCEREREREREREGERERERWSLLEPHKHSDLCFCIITTVSIYCYGNTCLRL